MSIHLATPRDWWEMLDREFNFTLDAAADDEHHMTEKYFTPEDNGLKQVWRGVVWCSPPWSQIDVWLDHAQIESRMRSSTVVVLAPVRPTHKWWFEAIRTAHEIRFIDGCLEYIPFVGTGFQVESHCLIIFKPGIGPAIVSVYPSRSSA